MPPIKSLFGKRNERGLPIGNLTMRLHAFARRQCRAGPVAGATAIPLAGARAIQALDELRTSVASYSGHLRHGNAWRMWKGTWARHPWLGALFAREGWAFTPRWPVRQVPARRFREQYWALAGGAGEGAMVFCPVGRYVEFYGPQRLVAERELWLRATYLPRAGFEFTVGFPRVRLWEYACRAIAVGCAVLLVGVGPVVEPGGPRRR